MLWYWIDYYWNSCYVTWIFRKVLAKTVQHSTFYGWLGRAKGPGEFIFQAFTEPKIQNLLSGGHHGAASEIYWLRYKPLVLIFSGVGTYGPCKTMYVKLLYMCTLLSISLCLYFLNTIIFGVNYEEVKTINSLWFRGFFLLFN